MPHESRVYFVDILEAIKKIEDYTDGISYGKFAKSPMIADAVVRNLEIIGEAVKKIPSEIKQQHSEIEWKKIAGLRDILIHEYFGIDLRIVWDIVQNKLPELKSAIKELVSEL